MYLAVDTSLDLLLRINLIRSIPVLNYMQSLLKTIQVKRNTILGIGYFRTLRCLLTSITDIHAVCYQIPHIRAHCREMVYDSAGTS